MSTTIPFFLVNRELASLVLDHLDHKTIGTFRLVCKSAAVCARSVFLRTSTKARLSEFSLTYAVQNSLLYSSDDRVGNDYPTLYSSKKGNRHPSDVSVEFIKDKMAHWEVIVLDSLSGLLEISHILATNNDLVAHRVLTVRITGRFIHEYMEAFPPFPPYEDAHAGSWAFVTFANRTSPRNLCISCMHNVDQLYDFACILNDFVSAWPLINVAWHWALVYSPPFVLNAPRYHIFGDTLSVNSVPETMPPWPTQASGIQLITYSNRHRRLQYMGNTVTFGIPSDCLGHAVDGIDMGELFGVRRCFPASPVAECPFCGIEMLKHSRR